jgi:hypothetical protein
MIKSLDKWIVQNPKRVCLITKESGTVPIEVDGKSRHHLRNSYVRALDCVDTLIESH